MVVFSTAALQVVEVEPNEDPVVECVSSIVTLLKNREASHQNYLAYRIKMDAAIYRHDLAALKTILTELKPH